HRSCSRAHACRPLEKRAMAKTVRDYLSQQLKSIDEQHGDTDWPADAKQRANELLSQIREIDDSEELLQWRNGDIECTPAAKRALAKRQAKKADRDELNKTIDALQGPMLQGAGFAAAVTAAGFDLKTAPSVMLPTSAALGIRSKDLTEPAVTTW